MKLNHPVGFAGQVYRPGQEAEFEQALATAKDAKALTPDLDALEAAGVLDQDAEPTATDETIAEAPKAAKSAKGKKAAKSGK